MTDTLEQDLGALLAEIYGNTDTVAPILDKIEQARAMAVHRQPAGWDQRDAILITYGDSLTAPGEAPLQTLRRFVQRYLQNAFSSVHILPFYPYSSDDGFAVIDYRQVNYRLGDWQDIRALAGSHQLMFDLVLNHVSRQSLWFIDFIEGRPPGCRFFIEADPHGDYSRVVRPRTSPLIVDVYTRQGIKHVWATFSDDQIDLNFADPAMLLEIVDILLFYLNQGARWIRLDAVAFLWKTPGTSCIHLPQTHAVVKLLRRVAQAVDAGAVIITETNVPHEENISYFGDGDEAQMIYQFALPPLVLHALNRGSAVYLNQWAAELAPPPPGCTFFNFIASHDGIGVRAVESIIPRHEIDVLIDSVHQYGGYVSMRSDGTGGKAPYELNISLFEALQGTRQGPDTWQVERFLCSQLIMLAMRGVPGIYLHSLTATGNDHELVEQTGRTRSINRHSWRFQEFEALLEQSHSPQARVFYPMLRLLEKRAEQPAFHPDGVQRVYCDADALVIIQRVAPDDSQTLWAIHNVTQYPQVLPENIVAAIDEGRGVLDLLSEQPWQGENRLEPYQVLWLVGMMDTNASVGLPDQPSGD